MHNNQLKSAYNVQIAAENYFIIHGYVSNDRTNYNTLIPIIKKQIASYIKLQDHEKRKTRAYKEDIGKYYT